VAQYDWHSDIIEWSLALRENVTSDRAALGTKVRFCLEVDVRNEFYWSCQCTLHVSVTLTTVRHLKIIF